MRPRFNHQLLLEMSLFAAPCTPGLRPNAIALLGEPTFGGVPSNFLGQATHTSELVSGCSDTCHVPGISSVLLHCSPEGPSGVCTVPTHRDTVVSPKDNGVWGVADWTQKGHGQADLPTWTSLRLRTTVSLSTLVSSRPRAEAATCEQVRPVPVQVGSRDPEERWDRGGQVSGADTGLS